MSVLLALLMNAHLMSSACDAHMYVDQHCRNWLEALSLARARLIALQTATACAATGELHIRDRL